LSIRKNAETGLELLEHYS
jgi:uncharacterized metal-binding protein YceD (DUF177 family)